MFGGTFHFRFTRNFLSLVKQKRYRKVCHKMHIEICKVSHKKPLHLKHKEIMAYISESIHFQCSISGFIFVLLLFIHKVYHRTYYLVTNRKHGLAPGRHCELVRTSDSYSADYGRGSEEFLLVFFSIPFPNNNDILCTSK
jgi:hypothetical protein